LRDRRKKTAARPPAGNKPEKMGAKKDRYQVGEGGTGQPKGEPGAKKTVTEGTNWSTRAIKRGLRLSRLQSIRDFQSGEKNS